MKSKPLTSLPALALAALVLTHPLAASAASPSELLEKGIYTEETKGDIDGAIAIYQQIADEAKTARALAAQAQLRLGQCYLKKNRTAEANAAFEKLIRTFDPNCDSTDGAIRLFPTDSLPDAARKTPRAWDEAEMARHKDVKVRPDSWENRNISGRLGVSCIADSVGEEKPGVKWLCYVLGPKWSEFYIISAPPAKFDAWKAAFETVVTSYRVTK